MGWFRPHDGIQSEDSLSILEDAFRPASVSILLDKCERRRAELLGWSTCLDCKLLAVITADGVYVAILVSIRDSIVFPAVLLVGLLACASMVLAYIAWRPHTYGTVPLDAFRNSLDIRPVDLRRVL